MKNFIRNGDFAEWPNGTSFTVAAGSQTTSISGDLVFLKTGASQPVVTISRQQHPVRTSIKQGFPRYFLRAVASTAPVLGATDKAYLTYTYSESLDRQIAQGAYGHFTFWAKSSVNREIVVRFYRSFGAGGSNNNGNTSEVVATQSFQLTTGWKKYQVDGRFLAYDATYGAGATVEARIYLHGGSSELGTNAIPWTTASVDISQAALTFTQNEEEYDTDRIASSTSSAITTIYATDPVYGAVGNYSGDMTTAGTGTDNRAAIQAALDAAHVQGSSFGSLVTGTSSRVVLPKGKYYISAPASGLPSLVVPARVEFDFSEAELFFQYPNRDYTANGITEPNPAWCGILVGANAGLKVGRMQSIWGADPTYGGTWFGMTLDAIRVYDSDRHFIEGGLIPHHIFNFRGAGIRYAGCWDAYLTNMSITNVCYGIVMGYVGTAFNQYQRYRTGGTPAESVSTNLHLHKVLCTNVYRTAIFVGAGNDWVNPASASIFYGGLETPNGAYAAQGGPISMVQCSFENCAYGILYGNATIGSIYMSDIRSEECGDNSISLGVIYNNALNFSIDKMSWGGTGTRNVTKASYTGPNTTGVLIPSTFLRNDGVNCAPHIKNLFISNSAGGCALIRKSSNARLPILENYRCNSTTQMQLTDSSVYNIIFKNTGHGIESLSTTGMAPNGAGETVNGVRTTFTFADGFTKVKPDRILVDGLLLRETNGDGSANWSWDSTTGVVTLLTAPVKDIRAFF